MSFPKRVKLLPKPPWGGFEEYMNDEDLEILSSLVDEESKGEVMQEFYKRNQVVTEKINDILNTEPKIEKVYIENNRGKRVFTEEFCGVYNDLNENFLKAHANKNDKFYAKIKGSKSSKNLDDWLTLNPIKTLAIQTFLNKLKKNDWGPELKFVDDTKAEYPAHVYDGEMGPWDGTTKTYYTGGLVYSGGYYVEIYCSL